MRKSLILLAIILLTATGFRISRPPLFSHPVDEEQIKKLNVYLEDLWNLQNGEFNFDITTTPKTNADNGDIWFVQTGSIIRMQYKAGGHVYTVSPDGF